MRYGRTVEKFEAKQEKPPIIDVDVDEAILETWEHKRLHKCISALVNEDFERTVPPDGKFILSPDNFAVTQEFIQESEADFGQFKAKNLNEKLNEVKNELRKVILNFTFKDLEFDVRNPITMREETGKKEDKEIITKYFATNHPGIVIVSDSADWWLERKSS